MAIRRHIIAARNSTPEQLTAALASLQVSEIETADGWCWAMASVWTTGAHELLEAMSDFEEPYFLLTTEDGCRWRFHLRRKGLPSFDTVHEFQWIRRNSDGSGEEGDWADLVEEDSEVKSLVVEFPGFPPLPAQRLDPLDFDDDFFAPYADDGEEEEDAEEEEWREPTPLAYVVEAYDENGIPLPQAIVEALTDLPDAEVYPRFLALHGAHIADALERFGVPHDREELLRILTGENVTESEMDSDIGNTWRFLHHLGLGPKFAEALQEHEAVAEQGPVEDPGANVFKAAGKLPLHDVEGGPARIPLTDAFLMARMTYYQDTYPEYVACIRFDAPVEWPAGRTPSYATWTPARKGFGGSVSLQGMDIPNIPKARKRLGELLATLPDGARLDLLAKGQYARTRLAGRAEHGAWLIESASAPLTSEEVAEMLTIFRVAEARGPQLARNEEEADAILKAAAQHMVLCNDPPRQDGLKLWCDDRRETEVLGGLFFRRRMAHRWDFKKIDAHVARKYKDWRQFEKEMARDNALPATDVVIYAGASSRFLEADYKARSMDKDMRANAKGFRAMDKTMAALGYTCLGAVVCEKVGGGILRCYANTEERTYSTGYILPYGQVWHDYYTRFHGDLSLTTTSGLSEGSFRSLRILVRHCSRTPVPELHAEHIDGMKRLAARGLIPVEIDATLEGVCRAMDEFLTRRLGA